VIRGALGIDANDLEAQRSSPPRLLAIVRRENQVRDLPGSQDRSGGKMDSVQRSNHNAERVARSFKDFIQKRQHLKARLHAPSSLRKVAQLEVVHISVQP